MASASATASASSGGIGFLGLCTIVLMTLKLLGLISISWFWVILPIMIPFIAVILFLVGLFVFLVLKEMSNGRRKL